VRAPAVAGSFYPADPRELSEQVDLLLATAPVPAPGSPRPGAVIVPHAGYVYSGTTAALAYTRLTGADVDKVVVVGPTHRVPVLGVALPTAGAFDTPLGQMPVWPQARTTLTHLPWVTVDGATHRDEHAIEVQLPFLQRVIGDVDIVPLNAGDASADQVADVIEALWDSPRTLVVISSDLSHYLTYEQAQEHDAATIDQIMTLAGPLDHSQACGATPINGMLTVARRRGLVPHLLGACNSGDTAGRRDRVVGYCAVAFEGPS